MKERDPKRAVALAYDGLCTFEFGVAVEVFGLPRPDFADWYSFQVAGLERGDLRAVGGVTLQTQCGIGALDRAGTILLPGWRAAAERPPERLLRKLRRAHDEGARILSVCSGAFILAATGLLDGKRATTHWGYADDLQRQYPSIEVDPDVLYVDEGNLLTSAGSAAGIDMCLHLVRRDYGAARASEVARRLVVSPHREGGQRQFVPRAIDDVDRDSSLSDVLQKVRSKLGATHSVESMARLANQSPRTFARRFREVTGTTPHRWLIAQRVEQAQALLEETDETVERVAQVVGFGDAQLLRAHFKRSVGATPKNYRRRFRGDRNQA